jgi:hypothetical protein
MTIPNPTDAPPLHTDADVLRRVEQLVGPATAGRQLWIMFLDGDGRQAPVVVPVSDLPRRPQHGPLDGLSRILAGLRDDLATDAGPGAVVLTFERIGTDTVLPADREWAAALTTACGRAGIALRGLFLSTAGGVRGLPD